MKKKTAKSVTLETKTSGVQLESCHDFYDNAVTLAIQNIANHDKITEKVAHANVTAFSNDIIFALPQDKAGKIDIVPSYAALNLVLATITKSVMNKPKKITKNKKRGTKNHEARSRNTNCRRK